MTDAGEPTGPGTPKHLWIVGILALLWDGMGAFDFVMTQTENERYLAAFTPEQREFFRFPWLIDFAWGVAVWGGVLGSVLLLARKRPAVKVFGLSLAAVIVTTVHNFGLSNGLEVLGGAGLAFMVVIIGVAAALLAYSRAMARAGVLT
ncbi:MAG: hypothetical protein QF903_02220 [Planctomycetota bacterium]|jgi:hypothetical protein|nr:hypothetical protein [Planctomycetota bacterium]MDP6764001.1 hypothetical protein [Planctomycetota bacterium]MDP6988275.1 hypothetical protein [Planctomycetota bacterium]